MRFRLSVTLFALLLGSTAGRTQSPGGTLRGVVEDRYGARVPCTRVTLELSSTLETRATVCDGGGEFRINELQPGAYHVSVASTGFAMATATVRVAVSSIQVVAVTMHPEGAHESV